MKKIGIVTINDISNYGNRLQNYALQNYLKQFGVSSYNIMELKKINLSLIIMRFKSLIKILLGKVNVRRINNFKSFNKSISYSPYKYIKNSNNININNSFDFFLIGSDQVWNPYFSVSDYMFLKGLPKEKKISFSASIGVDEIEQNMVDYYKDNLNDLKYISVREEQAQNIIKRITGRTDVKVLIDPTMLLTSGEWERILKEPKNFNRIVKGKYILNYFLGDLSESRRIEIQRIADENDCIVINLLSKQDPFYTCGPSEFLYLEKNAFLICTDSFHSSVFAIIFDKPFVVFNREQNGVKNMSSRIDNLLNTFELQDRKYNEKNLTNEILNHNYNVAYNILDKEKKKARDFIKKALDI